ncbi:MAG: M56 family metallopeptidase [Vicinamibacterales bacterium]
MPTTIDDLARWLIEKLLSGSIQGVVTIGLVWVLSRLFPRIPPAILAALWWLAALKLLLAFCPLPALKVPLLPAETAAKQVRAGVVTVEADMSAPQNASVTLLPARGVAGVSGKRWIESSRATLIALWLLGVSSHGIRLVRTHRRLRRIIRRSVPLSGVDVTIVARLAETLPVRVPHLRTSSDIDTPQLVGPFRPTVLLPSLTALTPGERTMALCHELMHVRRHDLLLGWVPALAERLFFFHPLVRLATREYVIAREAACDAAVVRALGVSPTTYGRLLFRMGVAGSAGSIAIGGASPSIASLKRRLEMLAHVGHKSTSRPVICLGAVVLSALLPIQLVARTSANHSGVTASERDPPSQSNALALAEPESKAAVRNEAGLAPMDASPDRSTAQDVRPSEPTGEKPAAGAQSGETRSVEQQFLRVRRQQLERQLEELRRQLVHEQTAAKQNLGAHPPITRDTVEQKKREYLASLQALQETQEHMMRLAAAHERVARVAGELQEITRQQQERAIDRQPRTYSRGAIVTLRPSADGTRLPDATVLAVPGDRIRVVKDTLAVNGVPVTTVSSEFLGGLPEEAWEQDVPPAHYFVVAEDQSETSATRFWGLIPADRINGTTRR